MPQLLRESTSISVKDNSARLLPLNESTQLVEATDGKKYKAVAAYLVEISRYNVENKNNRIYPKELWDHVIKDQRHIYEGAAGLANHPEKEGSVKDIFCVWHNMSLDQTNQTVKCEMYLVGEYGRLAKEFLDAGGRLELSSSGFGDIGFDQKTITPDSYLIERPADWVFDCSQSVWAKPEDEITVSSQKKETTDKTITNNNQLEENISNNNIVDITKEKEHMESKITEATLKLCLAYAKTKLQEATKEEDLTKKKAAFNEVISYCDSLGTDFDEIIQESHKGIADIESQFVSAAEEVKKLQPLQEKQEVLLEKSKELEEKNSNLKGKCENAVSVLEEAKNMISNLKRERELLKGLYDQANKEKNKVLEDAKIVLKYNDSLKEEVLKVKSEMRKAVLKEKMAKESAIRQLESLLENRKESRLEKEKTLKEAERKVVREKLVESIREKRTELEENTIEAKQKRLLENQGLNISYYPQAAAIREWYEDMLATNPEVQKHESTILSSSTLQEAQNRYRLLVSGAVNSAVKTSIDPLPPVRFTESFESESQPSALDLAIKKTKVNNKGFK